MAAKKKRTAAQIRATKRMLAANKKRRAGTKKKAPAKRKSSVKKPAKRKTTQKRRAPVAKKRRSTKRAAPKKTRRSSRRRGISAKKGMMEMVQAAGFGVAGGIVAGMVANKLPIADPRLKAAAPIVAGLLLGTTIGKKQPIVQKIGAGMVVLGAVALLKQVAPQVPMLAGEEEYLDMPQYDENQLLGYSDMDLFDDMDEGISGKVNLGEEDEAALYVSPANM